MSQIVQIIESNGGQLIRLVYISEKKFENFIQVTRKYSHFE